MVVSRLKAFIVVMRFEKTILQVIPALEGGGAERTTVELAGAIVSAGGRALVATSAGRLAASVTKAGGQVHFMPVASKNPLTILANRFRLIGLIRAEKVDIIHARSRAPAWSALMAARAAGIPFATTYHGSYQARTGLKRYYNSVMTRGDLVIANSAFTAAAIRAAYRTGDRLKVIPRGADLAEFNPSAISAARISAVRARFDLVENPKGPTLLLPGRLTDWKGHLTAVEAMAQLRAAAGLSPAFQLIFAGDGQGRGEFAGSLMRRVSELGLQEMIRWVGHCDDMPAAYAVADLVLSPSTRPEAFGRVAVEAGAMKQIVIAADHGGARETVVDGETGFLVEPGSAASLAAAIAKASHLSAAERCAMGDKARARIIERFSIEAMTTATLGAYQELLMRRDAPQ